MSINSVCYQGDLEEFNNLNPGTSKEFILHFREKIQELEQMLENLKGNLLSKEVVDLTRIAKEVTPSVVSIEINVTDDTLYSDESSGGAFFASGSGFIVSQDGFIVTNHHVIDGAQKINVFFNDHKFGMQATIWGSDPGTDLALLKVDAENLPYLSFTLDPVEIGSSVISIGNPLGFKNLLTLGVIGGKGVSLEDACGEGFFLTDMGIYASYILSDAHTNSGSSGSPILNTKGEVIGVHSRGGSGVGIHIDSQTAKRTIDELMKNKCVSRPFFGAKLTLVDDSFAELFELGNTFEKGLLLSHILEETPAMKAGFRCGDILIEYNGNSVHTLNQFYTDLAMLYTKGENLSAKVLRKGEILELQSNLDSYLVNATTTIERLGIEVEELIGDKVFTYNLDPLIEGVLISGAKWYSGLKPKEVITGILTGLGDPVLQIKNIHDLVSVLGKIEEGKTICLITRSPYRSQEVHYPIVV